MTADHQCDTSEIDSLIEYLKTIGAKVPVLMYGEEVMSIEKLMPLRKKYSDTYCIDDFSIISNYAAMDNLEQLLVRKSSMD